MINRHDFWDRTAGGPLEPGSWTHYPLDVEVADLHTMADAASVTDFVLAG